MEIQNRLKNFILDLDELQRLVHALLIPSCHDRHHISDKPYMAVDQQAIIRARLRVGLTCLSISSSVLWDILPCIDCLDAVHLHCGSLVYGCHHRICVRRSQKLHDQAVLRCDIIHIDRLSRYELHRVLFPYRLIYIFHDFSDSFPLFSFFHARNAWIPRSCPS